MSDLTTGWRKRHIALDTKSENARELGLDYEPDKTIIEMAREAGWMHEYDSPTGFIAEAAFKFAALVREDEREACAKIAWNMEPEENGPIETAIRARGNT
jgi:hypothetical protein